MIDQKTNSSLKPTHYNFKFKKFFQTTWTFHEYYISITIYKVLYFYSERSFQHSQKNITIFSFSYSFESLIFRILLYCNHTNSLTFGENITTRTSLWVIDNKEHK